MINLRAAFAPVLTLLICAGPSSASSIQSLIPSSLPFPAWRGGFKMGLNAGHDTWPLEIIFLIIFLIVVIRSIRCALWHARRWTDSREIVFKDLKYPNNHHVPGVGYYHAEHRRWFPLPWNELREAKGYYHGGAWHSEPASPPDPGMTFPDPEHVLDVNLQWRRANPEKMDRILDDVERRGFGQAVESIENYSRAS